MRYQQAILDALAGATVPLGHRDLVTHLDPNNTDRAAFNDIGLSLTRLYRAGLVTREYVTRDASQRRFYVYRKA